MERVKENPFARFLNAAGTALVASDGRRTQGRVTHRTVPCVTPTLTEPSKFTDPFIPITCCHQMMLAISICKRIEREINDFLSEAKVEAVVMVPTYSLTDLSNSLKAFNEGRLPIDAFSDIVFKHNS